MTVAVDTEIQLQEAVTQYICDPEGFVEFAYPWGQSGTILADEEGPDDWQRQILQDISHGLKNGYILNHGNKIDCTTGIRIAVRSGHGVGKTALMAWIDHWFSSTHPNPQMRTTANTKEQLSSTTWREMAKWHKLMINAHWFQWSATKFACLAAPETWFSHAVPQSDTNTQAFAGLHEKYVMVKFDEASAIPDGIWEVVEGAMTDVGGIRIWIVFGNPTQTTGRFAECWSKFRNMWSTYEIDSRTVKRTDKALIQKWIDNYGDDSDFVRVRVKGQAPRAGICQFIPGDIVENALGKVIHPSAYQGRPKILGVDIARFGDDKTVFIKRQGTAAFGLQKYSGLNTLAVAGKIAEVIKAWEPDQVFLDMGNTGAAVLDILIGWGQHYAKIVTGVWFGSSADDEGTYFNKRVEMWGRLRDWLPGAGIPDDSELRDDLIAPEYGFTPKEQFQLEQKKDMKKRGVASPDCGDALAITFAYPVIAKDRPSMLHIPDKNTATPLSRPELFGYPGDKSVRPSEAKSRFYD